MKREPRISLCMIARDEAATIGRALDLARPFVDEMIVVDTGSVDATPEVARQHGARVVHEPWADDFSRARNRSLDEARGDFALILDADEFMDEQVGREMREAVRRPRTYGVFLPIVNRFEDGKVLPALILRCFVLRPDLRFKNRIHEQVVETMNRIAVKEHGRLIKVEGEVTHTGYRQDVIESRGKNERNRRIFELALADDPRDLYLRYKFGDFLRQFPADRTRARDILQDAADQLSAMPRQAVADLPFAGDVFALLAQLVRDAGQPQAALEIAEQGLRVTDPTINLRFMLASIAVDLGDATTAAREFRRCLAAAGQVLVMPPQPGVTDRLSEIGLARALQLQNQDDEARECLERAYEPSPNSEEVLRYWLECARRTKNPRAALKFIIGVVGRHPERGHAWEIGGELLYGVQFFDEARKWFARATVDPERRGLAQGWIAETFLHEGRLEEAIETAAAAPDDPRSQAVIAAVSIAAEMEVPSLVHPEDDRVKASFRVLIQNLRRTKGADIAARVTQAKDEMKIFDPAGLELVVDALAAVEV